MPKLESLLEYQASDIALIKIKREIAGSAEQKRYEKTLAEFHAAQKTVADNEEAASKIVAFYQKVLKEYKSYASKAEELIGVLQTVGEDDYDRHRELLTEIETLRSRIIQIEKRLAESKTAAENIVKASVEARTRQKKLKEDGTLLKQAVDALRAKHEPVMLSHAKKMEKLKQGIDPALFEWYKKMTAEKKYPPVAPVNEMNKSSFCYCGMELSGRDKEQLAQDGQCICGSCGRIVYKK